ncbi:MAG: hypothetical protein ACPG5T_01245 [Endozoicomonas sp.]
MFDEFQKIEQLEKEMQELRADQEKKQQSINSLRKKVNEKLASMEGFLSYGEPEKIIYNLNYYYNRLCGAPAHEKGELIDLQEFPNLFSWLQAYNIMKVTNPGFIEFEGGEKFIAGVYLTFNANCGPMGEPRILAYGNNNCLYLASQENIVPGAVKCNS